MWGCLRDRHGRIRSLSGNLLVAGVSSCLSLLVSGVPNAAWNKARLNLRLHSRWDSRCRYSSCPLLGHVRSLTPGVHRVRHGSGGNRLIFADGKPSYLLRRHSNGKCPVMQTFPSASQEEDATTTGNPVDTTRSS